MKAQITLDVTAEELATLEENARTLMKYEWYAFGDSEIYETGPSTGGWLQTSIPPRTDPSCSLCTPYSAGPPSTLPRAR
jgi:hypothetical protein